jgi:hypothetical protein
MVLNSGRSVIGGSRLHIELSNTFFFEHKTKEKQRERKKKKKKG